MLWWRQPPACFFVLVAPAPQIRGDFGSCLFTSVGYFKVFSDEQGVILQPTAGQTVDWLQHVAALL